LGPRFAELIGRRPTGGGSQKKSGQQKTDSHGPAPLHRLTSCSLGTPLITISGSRAACHCPCLGGFTSLSPFNRHQEADLPCRELPCLWSTRQKPRSTQTIRFAQCIAVCSCLKLVSMCACTWPCDSPTFTRLAPQHRGDAQLCSQC
jgi:hypothetical protein